MGLRIAQVNRDGFVGEPYEMGHYCIPSLLRFRSEALGSIVQDCAFFALLPPKLVVLQPGIDLKRRGVF